MKNVFKYLRRIGAIGAATVLLSSAVACSSSDSATEIKDNETPAAAELNATDHLNVALQQVTGYIPLYVVRDQGLLEEALADYDIDITFTVFESGPPENESFASGGQDVGVMGNVPSLSGIAAGQDRAIIGIAYNGEKTIATVTNPDSGIASVEDLKGKKIGLVIGSIAENLLNTQLTEAGLTYDDVELVNLSPAEQQAALESGQIDAVTTWEPTLTKLKNNSGAVVVADGTGIFLGENPIIANRAYVEANPEIVRIFLETYKKAVEIVESDLEATAKTYAADFGLSEEELLSALENAKFPIDLTDEDVTDLQSTVDFLYGNELITTDFEVSDYVIK